MYINFKNNIIPLYNYKCLDMKAYEDLPEEHVKKRILQYYDKIVGDDNNEC